MIWTAQVEFRGRLQIYHKVAIIEPSLVPQENKRTAEARALFGLFLSGALEASAYLLRKRLTRTTRQANHAGLLSEWGLRVGWPLVFRREQNSKHAGYRLTDC